MEDLIGRYIKVLKNTLGGNTRFYKVGDYLKVLENPDEGRICHEVEHAGTLNLTGSANRIYSKDVELMPEGWKPLGKNMYSTLSEFPSEGVCWQPNKELRAYLSKKYSQYSQNEAAALTSKGIGWGKYSYWAVENSSGKPEYHISQLEPFLFPDKDKQWFPIVGEWCYYMGAEAGGLDTQGYWEKGVLAKFNSVRSYDTPSWEFSDSTSSNMRVCSNKACAFRKATQEEINEISEQHLTTKEYFERILSERPLTPQECFTESLKDKYRIPDKWCIRGEHQEVLDYANKYGENPPYETPHLYYHFPPFKLSCTSCITITAGYTEITIEQFRKHVLTHTNEKQINLNLQENECNSIKVQRTNLSVRDTGSIRATGIRCPKVKIEVRSGHLPN